MALSVKLQTSSQTGQPLWWKEGKIFKVLFIIAATVNYAAGGDVLDLTQLFNLASSAPGQNIPTFDLPVKVEIQSARLSGGANNANLFTYGYAPGTTLANGTMQVFTGAAAQTGLTELTAGAYPAGVLTDVIQAEVYFLVP